MKSFEHIQEYDLILEAKSPVFVGSGDMYYKTEYIYDRKNKVVHFLNKDRFFQYLLTSDHIDEYEYFIMSGQTDLQRFLTQKCHITEKELHGLIQNSVSTADALDDKHSLKNIQAFCQLPDGKMYIPGSSVKGCLRTVLLTSMLVEDKNRQRDHIPEKMKYLEQDYLHTLKLTDKKQDEINSIMRGISISDSEPILAKDMILCSKVDISPDGYENKVIVVRQCVAPETEIKFRLTLDRSILGENADAKWIKHALQVFDRFYIETYTKHFMPVSDGFDEFGQAKPFVVLGGGSGFFGKNLIYPFFDTDYEKGLKKTAEMMKHDFGKHHHERDVSYQISPHMKKATIFDNAIYTMGLCKVILT